jgi:hypothetical protein
MKEVDKVNGNRNSQTTNDLEGTIR